MLWGYTALGLLLIILIVGIIIYMKNAEKPKIETFLAINDSILYTNPTETNTISNKPENIQYQIPVSANQLSDKQIQSIDTDVLRNVRVLTNFSMTDEFDFYQIYSLLKQIKKIKYNFNYVPIANDLKSNILPSEKLIAINSGAINNTDLELFTRLKLELISSFNSLIIKNNLFVPYHPYQFFKIINSNMISNNKISPNVNSYNFVFTLTLAREYKFQQFVIYYDIDLVADTTSPNTTSPNTTSSNISYTAILNKLELIGIPIPNTIQFHPNQKTDLKSDNSYTGNTGNTSNTKLDFYEQDQVSDSLKFDVIQSGDPSVRSESPYVKYIDITETRDMDSTMFNQSSLANKIEDRIMNVARDQQYNNHRCYGLVNGVSQELPQYKNPIFCKSYHPETNQNGIWDAPCQVNSDCPFYKANKNYPNEFGKCDKASGQCEMPMGVIPIGFTKYGKQEPNCYNCGADSMDSKCCGSQAESIKSRIVRYKSPDYIFTGDESFRRQFSDELKNNGLLVNPSI